MATSKYRGRRFTNGSEDLLPEMSGTWHLISPQAVHPTMKFYAKWKRVTFRSSNLGCKRSGFTPLLSLPGSRSVKPAMQRGLIGMSKPLTVQARLSYRNPSGSPGEVMEYRCPVKGCHRTHLTLLADGVEAAHTVPPCKGGMAGRNPLVKVLPPLLARRFEAAPLDEWGQKFQTERRRALGGRPPRTRAVSL